MRVTVLYFAAVRELAGMDQEELGLPDAVSTVAAFVAFLEARYEALRGRMGSVRVARNEAFVGANEPLAEGDVLALIPPVAGGS